MFPAPHIPSKIKATNSLGSQLSVEVVVEKTIEETNMPHHPSPRTLALEITMEETLVKVDDVTLVNPGSLIQAMPTVPQAAATESTNDVILSHRHLHFNSVQILQKAQQSRDAKSEINIPL